MAEKKTGPGLLQRRWIHSFEEDAAEAQLFLPGAQDRPEAADASWTEEDGKLVIRTIKKAAHSPLTLHIVESTADKLLVRRS